MMKHSSKRESHTPVRRSIVRHSCELAQTSHSCLPRLPPNAKNLSRLKRKFQKLILVSEKHPLTRFFLRSRAAVALEKKRHGRQANWWVIHPCSNFRFAWEILMILAFLYLFVAVPYVNAFYRICNKGDVDILHILYPAYAICVIDIFINFITGFASGDGHEIILNPAQIARHYSQGYFLIDLFTSVPYTWLSSTILRPPGSETNFPAVIAESLPLFKLLRMWTLRNYVKKFAMIFELSGIMDATLWLCLLTCLVCHWSACLTYAFPFFVLHATRTTIEDSETYAIQSGLHEEPNWRIYLISLHMGVSNLIGSSFVEFEKTSLADKIIRCLLLFFGTGYTVYLIVIILQLVESSSKPEIKYQEVMNQVVEYTREKKCPPCLKKKLIDYYKYRFQGSYFKERAISNTLSNHLKQEINMRSIRGLLETATVFHNLSRSQLATLMSSVKPLIYLENDVIFKCHTEGDAMFFISSGTVAVINYAGKEICHLEDGNYFGEISLIYPERRRDFTVMALEVCELLRLDRRDFKRLVPPKTELYARLERVANERIAQAISVNKMTEEEEEMRKNPVPIYRKPSSRLPNDTGNSRSSSFT